MKDSAYGQVGTVVLTLVFGVLLGGGFVDPGIDCWTRERYQTAARIQTGPIRDIRAGTYRCEVVREDPDNWWTGVRFTGEPCKIAVEHRPYGTYAYTHLMDEAVGLRADGSGGQPVLLGRDGGREGNRPATPRGASRFTHTDGLPSRWDTELRSLWKAKSAILRVPRRTRIEEPRHCTGPTWRTRRTLWCGITARVYSRSHWSARTGAGAAFRSAPLLIPVCRLWSERESFVRRFLRTFHAGEP